MPPILPQEEIDKRLKEINDWRQDDRYIVRDLSFPSFKEAITFVNRVAEISEEIDHHPDIAINYKRVTLSITTHSEGGITRRDFRLAGRIDGLL